MAIKGLSIDSTEEYVSKLDPAKGEDREADDATIFTLGTMSARTRASIRDAATAFKRDPDAEKDDETGMLAQFRPNESTYLTVQFGLRSWRRFMDEGGNEIEFKTAKRQLGGREHTVVSDESMDRLSVALVRELADQIDKINEPKKEELGN